MLKPSALGAELDCSICNSHRGTVGTHQVGRAHSVFSSAHSRVFLIGCTISLICLLAFASTKLAVGFTMSRKVFCQNLRSTVVACWDVSSVLIAE